MVNVFACEPGSGTPPGLQDRDQDELKTALRLRPQLQLVAAADMIELDPLRGKGLPPVTRSA
jgi:hypothetical protein